MFIKIMYFLVLYLFLDLCTAQAQYSYNQNPPPRYYSPVDEPYYKDVWYEPRLVDQVSTTIQSPNAGLNQVFSVVFSCGAMVCIMFIKRPLIKRIFKTRSSSFINQVGMIAQTSRQVGIMSVGLLVGAQFHSFGQLLIGTLLNIFILILAVYYSTSKERKQTLLATLIGMTTFAYSFTSNHLNNTVVHLMPFIGSTILVCFRISLIPKIYKTKQIVGTTTYRTLYLGACGLTFRMSSFLVISQMNWSRWYNIGMPLLAILLLIYFHLKWEIKEPDLKRLQEQQSRVFKSSDLSFSKKSK